MERILVVDDNKALAKLIVMQMEKSMILPKPRCLLASTAKIIL